MYFNKITVLLREETLNILLICPSCFSNFIHRLNNMTTSCLYILKLYHVSRDSFSRDCLLCLESRYPVNAAITLIKKRLLPWLYPDVHWSCLIWDAPLNNNSARSTVLAPSGAVPPCYCADASSAVIIIIIIIRFIYIAPFSHLRLCYS